MSDRRFSESEIREVFERAAREQHAARREAQDGLTLAEMQEVAASAGIDPAFVASAARSVSLGEPETGRLSTGPVARGVFRTEFLPGPPTDALWQQVVADCRRTFDAQGEVTEGGGVREWRNGNLRVALEAAGAGSRLHLRTRRDDRAHFAMTAAAIAGVAILLAFVSSLDAFSDPEALRAALTVALGTGLGAAGTWASQRSWASTRERQMAEIAQRAASASGPAAQTERPVASGRIDLDALDLDVSASEESRTGARTRTR